MVERVWIWITRGRVQLSSHNKCTHNFFHKCVTCKKLRGEFDDQRISDLLKERWFEAAPFTHSGVDMFGLFTIRKREVQT